MTGKEIRFVDTTLRDGHLSLWASGMTTSMIMPIAERMDQAGFEAIEVISGAQFKKFIRELKDDPFERLQMLAKRFRNTPLRVTGSRINTFGFDPKVMYQLYLDLVARNGVQQARLSDPWNDYEGMKRRITVARTAGLEPLANIIFSVSPRHTDEYYADRIRRIATLPAYRLCLKDPGGLLTPERVRTLVPIMIENAGGHEIELHTHCTTGLGPLCALEAIKLGIKYINTAIPPLADGASLPSLFNVAANARALGYATDIDEEVLQPVSKHFTAIARREGLPIGRPVEYDYAQYQHQIPGGMISNLAHQLKLVGLEDRLSAALEETIQVRAELAYPIMVTPLSQFVGSQAAINIVVGERYREVTDQIINYALGRYGKEGAAEMDENVKDKILDRPRARELEGWVRPDPTLDDMRRSHGGRGTSDEDMMLRWITSREEVAAMHAAGPSQDYLTAGQPLVDLVRALTSRSGSSRISIQRPGFSLRLEKSSPAG